MKTRLDLINGLLLTLDNDGKITIRDTFNGTFDQIINKHGKTIGGSVTFTDQIVKRAKSLLFAKGGEG